MLFVIGLALFAAWFIDPTVFLIVGLVSFAWLALVLTGTAAAVWSYRHGEKLT